MDKKAYLYVLITALLWGSAPAVGKIMLKDLTSYQLLFYTSLTASISLFIISFLQGKLKIIKNYKRKDYITFALMAFLGVFLYYLFYYGALTYTSAQEAFMLNYTWPVWVVIFASLILKEPFTPKKFIAMIMGFIGICLITAKGDLTGLLVFRGQSFKGQVLALLGAACYGLFSVLGKKYNYERFTSGALYYFFTFLFISIYLRIFSYIPIINIKQVIAIIWLGAFSSGIASVCWFLALQYGDTSKMANLIFITPFVSLIYIFSMLGEKIMASSLIGLFFIALGIILENLDKCIKFSKVHNN